MNFYDEDRKRTRIERRGIKVSRVKCVFFYQSAFVKKHIYINWFTRQIILIIQYLYLFFPVHQSLILSFFCFLCLPFPISEFITFSNFISWHFVTFSFYHFSFSFIYHIFIFYFYLFFWFLNLPSFYYLSMFLFIYFLILLWFFYYFPRTCFLLSLIFDSFYSSNLSFFYIEDGTLHVRRNQPCRQETANIRMSLKYANRVQRVQINRAHLSSE